jgi:hypothetical protein
VSGGQGEGPRRAGMGGWRRGGLAGRWWALSATLEEGTLEQRRRADEARTRTDVEGQRT